MPSPLLSSRPHLVSVLLASLLLAACDQQAPDQNDAGMHPPEVKVEIVQPQRVVVKAELPGRVQARRTAEVRARVEGIIQERLFTEGSEVKAGDLLFQIDPATLRAVLDATKANVARAEADLAQAQLKQKRLQNLLARNAVSPRNTTRPSPAPSRRKPMWPPPRLPTPAPASIWIMPPCAPP